MLRRLTFLLFAAAPALAAYPTPAEAGFHHCALIYEAAQRGPEAFAPYVSRGDTWLFDSFLFLIQRTGTGRATMTGETVKEDWQYHLDRWFAPDRDLPALDAATAAAAARLGQPPRRPIMLSVPYVHRGVKDFGDVTGDGVGEDLSTPTGRQAVLRWYLDAARERFAAAGFRHLALWGFYYMNETVVGADGEVSRLLADEVHARGLRLLWIPWYRAAGWDAWRDYGFDVAILQPNYAFLTTHLGRIRRNRLANTAELAREAAMGVEIELPMAVNLPGAARLFRHYLRDGAPDRYGYQAAATAYYLGGTQVEQLAASTDPALRAIYDDLATYVANQTVAEPDEGVAWTVAGQPAPALGDHRLTPAMAGVTTAEGRFDAPREVGTVDVFLDEPEAAWRGTVVVETLGQDDTWRPGGWALRSNRDPRSGRWQVATVPVPETARGLRVKLQGAAGSPPPAVSELTPLPPAFERQRVHLGWRRPYQAVPTPPAQYPDHGGELTDGVTAGGYGSGHTVGWHGTPCSVTFDLGREVLLTGGEAWLQGGGTAAVNWPSSAQLLVARDQAPPPVASGAGAPPAGFAWCGANAPVVTLTRGRDDQDGRLDFAFDQPVPARYATFQFSPSGWLMLAELRLFAGGANLVAGQPYRVTPAPTAQPTGGPYRDDGLRLTDGVVAQHFAPAAVVGWNDGESRTWDVDLGWAQPLRQVTAWSLGGGGAGIYAPAQVTFELSADGQTWQPAGEAARPALDETTRGTVAVPYRATLPADPVARFVRVTIPGARVWTMLSEIEVE